MLTLTNLSKSFSSLNAVQQLSLDVPKGEIFVLLGPNGAGKTTTIKMITGIHHPTTGSIGINGFDIVKQPELAKSHLGYIPDEPFVYEKLTGREFLYFVGKLFALEEKTIHQRLSHFLELYPLADAMDMPFGSYSRGTKQKFSIIAAMLHEPKLLVVDEPIVGLDPQSTQVTRQLFLDFKAKGGTIFLSTHTLSFAETIADRIGILSIGKLLDLGTLQELKNKAHKQQATLEELFLELTESRTVPSCQLPVASCQLPVASCQLSAVSC